MGVSTMRCSLNLFVSVMILAAPAAGLGRNRPPIRWARR
jgi:hypothetical protein